MSGATKHSVVLIGAFVATSVLNYVFGVAMSWFLSPTQFGVLGVAQSLLLLTALAVGSGFAWTTAHDLVASGVTDRSRHRFRAAWTANVALGLILGGGLWTAYASGWIPLGPAYRAVVPLVGLTTLLLAARSVINGAVRGLCRFGLLAVNQVGEVVIKAGAGLALVAAGAGVAGVMSGFALGTAAALAHSLWITRSARLWRGRGWVDSEVVATTAPLFVGIFGTALMLNLDILGLKLFAPAGKGDELAGFYQAAVILARIPVFVAQTLVLVLFSYIAGTKGQAQESYRGAAIGYVHNAVRAWARLLLPAGLVLVLAPRTALSLFFPAHCQAAAPALQIAAGGGVLLSLVTLLAAVVQAIGDRRRPALAAAVATAVQVAFLVWLVPHWSALGAAGSLVIAGGVALIGLAPAFKRYFGSMLPGQGGQFLLRLYRSALPLLALAVPLLLLPDGGRGRAILKLGLAGLTHLVALIGAHASAIGNSDGPVAHLFTQFMRILTGGER